MVSLAEARRIAGDVPDPELPVLTLGELGVVREVNELADGRFEVVITPTYSGCPALSAIRDDLARALPGATVTTVLSPPWSTDWITEEGREKLREHGIAPPRRTGAVDLVLAVRCPRCGSPDTELVSRFSSTACKALHRCRSCLEPFDHVKEI
ncbi:MAG: phenylacetate-CoA oxygenase subunit PaaJ [Thermoactinospora sp.]|nr:phenylacetate-CoA oxygenase subunit PaaJ [Thermoactinospora sp.]